MFLNTFQAAYPAPERYQISIYIKKYFSGAGEVFKYTSLAPEKPGKYLKTPFQHRRSIYTHISGAGEVFIYNYPAPDKPEKHLYTPRLIPFAHIVPMSL